MSINNEKLPATLIPSLAASPEPVQAPVTEIDQEVSPALASGPAPIEVVEELPETPVEGEPAAPAPTPIQQEEVTTPAPPPPGASGPPAGTVPGAVDDQPTLEDELVKAETELRAWATGQRSNINIMAPMVPYIDSGNGVLMPDKLRLAVTTLQADLAETELWTARVKALRILLEMVR